VTEDRPVDVGSILERWNPLSHLGYWSDGKVADAIADGLAGAWHQSSAMALLKGRAERAAPRRAAGATRS